MDLRKVIAIDQDDVVADLVGKWIHTYNKDFNDNLTKKDITSWNIASCVKSECGIQIYDYLKQPGFYADLEVIEGSREVIEHLTEFYDIYFVTSAMAFPSSFNDKYTWLRTYFPFVPADRIVFCGDKRIVRADYLIDDSPRNLLDFDGIPIVYDTPYNQNVDIGVRVNNWNEILQYFSTSTK